LTVASRFQFAYWLLKIRVSEEIKELARTRGRPIPTLSHQTVQWERTASEIDPPKMAGFRFDRVAISFALLAFEIRVSTDKENHYI